MSYDYFLWRMKRVVDAKEINESTVESWTDIERLRAVVSELWPTLKWRDGGPSGDDCSGATSVRAVSLPSPNKRHDPLVVRGSHRDDGTADVTELGRRLECLVYDTQTGEIVYQPQAGAED